MLSKMVTSKSIHQLAHIAGEICRTQIVRLYLKTTEARYISTEVAQESFNISLLNQRTSSLYRLGAGGSPPGPLELGLEFDPSDGAGAGLIGRLMMF